MNTQKIVDVNAGMSTDTNYNFLVHSVIDAMLWPERYINEIHYPEGEYLVQFSILEKHSISVEEFIKDLNVYWKETPFLKKYGELSFSIKEDCVQVTRKKIDWNFIEKHCTWEKI